MGLACAGLCGLRAALGIQGPAKTFSLIGLGGAMHILLQLDWIDRRMREARGPRQDSYIGVWRGTGCKEGVQGLLVFVGFVHDFMILPASMGCKTSPMRPNSAAGRCCITV